MPTPRKGQFAPQWVARYLSRWWPNATAVTFGVRGTDIVGTHGIAWEIKAARDWKPTGYVAQARRHAGNAQLPVVVYVPNGCGEQSIEFALAIVPLHRLVDILDDAGYTTRGKRSEVAP